MKTLRLWLMAALCVSLAAACGSDDEPSNGNPEGDGHNVAENLTRPGKKVRRIISYPGESTFDWSKWGGDDYVYDEKGRLVEYAYYQSGSMVDYGEHLYPYRLTYSGNEVILKEGRSGRQCTYHLNAQGYAVSAVYEHAGTENGTTVFTYSPDGYLLSAEGGRYKETFKWEDGNLVEHIEYDSKDGDSTTSTYVYDLTMPNTYGIQCGSFSGYYDGSEAFYAGILGKATKNLVTSYTYAYTPAPGSSYPGPSTQEYDVTYSYTFAMPDEGEDAGSYTFPLYVIE